MHPSLADAVLLVHFAFVAFIVGGLALIWIGAAWHWRWVRNFRFRLTHLCAIGFVAIETVIGMACPLTIWEATLRGEVSGHLTFIERLVAPILFFDLPPWVFTALHLGFAVLVALTFWLVPPYARKPRTAD